MSVRKSHLRDGTDYLEHAAELRRGLTRLGQRLRFERRTGAISSNKLSVLGHLYRQGPCTPGDIAAAEHQHPQSLTRIFAELEHSGLVARTRSDQDGRQSVLTITSAGQEKLLADMAQRDAWLADALVQVTEAEADLLRIAARLMNRLADIEILAAATGTPHRRRSA
jgi:DNA-binding MarR family transcriptional regulator